MNCRSPIADRKAQLLALLDAGRSHREIAAAVGVTRDTVRYWARRTGLLSHGQLRRMTLAAEKAAGVRTCSRCGESQPLAAYYFRHSTCKGCVSARAAGRLRTPVGKWRQLMFACRHRALARGAACDLSEPLLQAMWDRTGGRCEYTGEPMTTDPGQWNTVSVDRIDSGQGGYTVGNVALCCAVVNLMKRDMPAADFYRLCEGVAAHRGRPGGGPGAATDAEAGIAAGGFGPIKGRRRVYPLPDAPAAAGNAPTE